MTQMESGVTCAQCGRVLSMRRTDPMFAKLRGNMVRLANGTRALEFTIEKDCPDCGASAVHVPLRK